MQPILDVSPFRTSHRAFRDDKTCTALSVS